MNKVFIRSTPETVNLPKEELMALGRLVPLYDGYTSPGGCTEYTHQFVMFVDSITTPTDPEEGIEWEWMTGYRVAKAPFKSMQLQNAINTYRINRDKLVAGI